MKKGLIVGHSDAQHQPAGPAGSDKRLLRLVTGIVAVCLFIFIAGFFAFLNTLDRDEPMRVDRGDGIVALTGGADRIADALDLLAQGRGNRLLISGVGNQVSLSKIGKAAPGLDHWLKCCVDLDYKASNTVGNAEEARIWASIHGYRSIVLVTSSYHMPRALLELRRHMPGVHFIPAPVVTERMHDLAFWRDIALLKTLGQEYAKFVVAYARARLTSPATMVETIAMPSRRRA